MEFTARNTKGLFARGTPDECPPDRVLEARNLMGNGPNLVPRPGFIFSPLGTNRSDQSHLSIFQPLPVAGVLNPQVISQDINNSGISAYKMFNTSFVLPIPIFTADKPYHSWINFYGRGYFTIHDTVIASSTQNVQVYEGGAASRNAAGAKPISAMAGVLSGTPGNLGVGIYLFDVVYVTVSGFITKPSGSVVQVTSFGSGSVDLSVIPTGPAGTAKRQIIATKAINLSTYTGNPNDYEFFIVPTGLINDNVTTILNVSFFDGNLVDSADPLNDLLETIPSGVGIGEFSSRMMVWGEAANPSVVRLSFPGEPESFSATSGIIVVDPTESGGVTNCVGFNGQLYITKSNRIFLATDNGGDPSTWEVILYDGGVGTEPYGISQVLDSKGKHLNQFLIAARQGLILFDGVIRTPELTYWVQDIWKDIDQTKISLVQIFMDPKHHLVFCLLPRNGSVYNILVGDFSDGLNPDTIKWYLWEHFIGLANNIYAMSILTKPDNSLVVYVSDTIQINEFNLDNPSGLDGFGFAFVCTLQTPPIITNPDDQIQQITEVRVRQIGGGVGDISAQGVSANDSTLVSPAYVIPFIGAPTKTQDKRIYLPFVDIQPTVKILINSTNKPKLSRVWITGDTYGTDTPE